MTNFNDPSNPYTSFGQTAAGSLIHSQNEMFRRMNEENRRASEDIRRRSGVAAGGGTASASDVGRRLILIAFVVGSFYLIYREYGGHPSDKTLLLAAGGTLLGAVVLRALLLTGPGLMLTKALALTIGWGAFGAGACLVAYGIFHGFGIQGLLIAGGVVSIPFVLTLLSRASGWFFHETKAGRAALKGIKIVLVGAAGITFIYIAGHLFA